MKKLLLAMAMMALVLPVFAQNENLLAEKPIKTLGEPLIWTAGEESYTFKVEDLPKLVAVPTNTSNVFLYPQNGTLNTPENREKGAQVFYIDLGSSKNIGIVTTTWEGAAADSYNIYLTDVEPTEEILTTTPTFTVSGLGQYEENNAKMPENSKGRYLVFQVTKATNWEWGVKIRSISAFAPSDDVLTTFKVSPAIVMAGEQTPVTLTLLNQYGLAIAQDDVEIKVSENAVYENGQLTITSGTSAIFTATLGDATLTSTVYIPTAPGSPAEASIKTPIYTNTITDYNAKAEFSTGYNGGAQKVGELTFDDGEVAYQFGNARCIFFSNKETTGAWNGNINPSDNDYRELCLAVFSASTVDCTIEFESVENLEGGPTYPFSLNAGEWTPISVNVAGATKLGNLSIRFTEDNMADILLANIYFTPAFVEGDETAPVLGELKAVAGPTFIDLTLTATDDLSEDIFYSISDGTNSYEVSGKSGEPLEYTITGLQPSTTYNLTITANDGKNISEPKQLEVATLDLTTFEIITTLPIYNNKFPPQNTDIFIGESVTVSYIYRDKFGIVIELEGTPTLTVSGAGILNDDGTITATSVGVITIEAELDGLNSNRTIKVFDPDTYCITENVEITTDAEDATQNISNIIDGGKRPTEYGGLYGLCNEPKAGEYSHYISMDLGANYDLDMVIAIWEGAAPRDYDVYLGSSEDDLELYYSVTGHSETTWNDRFSDKEMNNIRWIKIITTYNATGYGLKIYELKAYGKLNLSQTAVVGEFEAKEWHPGTVVLEDVIAVPEGVETNNIVATITPVDVENWSKKEDLPDWDKTGYEEIMQGMVTASDNTDVQNKCDGYYNEAKAEVVDGDNSLSLELTLDCSGLYEITLEPAEGSQLMFMNDGDAKATRTITKTVAVYPSLNHKYTYNHGKNEKGEDILIKNDIFSINDCRYDGVSTLNYDKNNIDALKNAQIYVPGVYGAEIYYWIEASANPGQSSEPGIEPGIESLSAKRKAASLGAEYKNYTNSITNGGTTDLSALANGGTLHIVMAKNGAVTPLQSTQTGASETQIGISLSDNVETGIEAVEGEGAEFVDVFNMQGICVKRNVKAADAADGLPAGLYIVGGKKVLLTY